MLTLTIREKQMVARDICRFELVAPDGGALPPFTAGGHIAVETPSGAMRQYSLCNHPGETGCYVIALKRESGGRGGSASMVDQTAIGQTLQVSEPGNDFPLVDAPDYLLIAGGIGITPILCMARVLTAAEKPFRLIYCSRGEEDAAFLNVLRSDAIAGEVTIHHDGGDPDRIYDFWDLFAEPTKAHVFCCGPAPLMAEVRDMTGHWNASAIHFEDFKPIEAIRPDDVAFQVTLAKSRMVVQVPADHTILESVRRAGISVASSCESGSCGTCKTGLVSGVPDHRDLVLLDEEKADNIMICVSRASSGDLIIDL